MGNSANSREARFGDTGKPTIVLVSDAATIKPDDSRKLRGNVSEKHVLKLLEEEKNKSVPYNKAWNNAVEFLKRKELITSTSDYNSCLKVAVCCYTVEDPQFYVEFNELCRGLKTTNWDSFPFQSMWHMLTDAIFRSVIKSNPPVSGGSFKTFRGLSFHIPQNELPKVGVLVHSKQFMSTSVEEGIAKKFAGESGTIIEFVGKPKAGKGIKDYSWFPSEGEVLFAPWEAFRVIRVDNGKDLHKIVLQA